MSPAFLNRFLIIVLENQLKDCYEENIEQLMTILIKNTINKKELIKKWTIKFQFNFGEYDDNSTEEEEKIDNNNNDKEDGDANNEGDDESDNEGDNERDGDDDNDNENDGNAQVEHEEEKKEKEEKIETKNADIPINGIGK